MSKQQKPCPHCGKLVGGTNPSILEINFAEHLKKHELSADSQKAGRLHTALKTLSSTPVMTTLILVSFVSGNWLVENLYKIAYPWFYVSFPIVLFSLSAFVMKRARSHIRAFGYGLLLSVSWVISLIIGRLVSAFLDLLQELFPFYQNPWVLALWADYFIILAAMVYAQSKVGKMMALMEPGNRLR